MIFIAHRGNVFKTNIKRENSPEYIEEAIDLGFDVEIDIRIEDGKIPPGEFFLGHDYPQYRVDLSWLIERKRNLWIHAKNIDALSWFLRSTIDWNVFWHQEDNYTITSNGYIWAYPGQRATSNTIIVMPEITFYSNDMIKSCAGICSDNINFYRERFGR
jgi:hypothetical protein